MLTETISVFPVRKETHIQLLCVEVISSSIRRCVYSPQHFRANTSERYPSGTSFHSEDSQDVLDLKDVRKSSSLWLYAGKSPSHRYIGTCRHFHPFSKGMRW